MEKNINFTAFYISGPLFDLPEIVHTRTKCKNLKYIWNNKTWKLWSFNCSEMWFLDLLSIYTQTRLQQLCVFCIFKRNFIQRMHIVYAHNWVKILYKSIMNNQLFLKNECAMHINLAIYVHAIFINIICYVRLC